MNSVNMCSRRGLKSVRLLVLLLLLCFQCGIASGDEMAGDGHGVEVRLTLPLAVVQNIDPRSIRLELISEWIATDGPEEVRGSNLSQMRHGAIEPLHTQRVVVQQYRDVRPGRYTISASLIDDGAHEAEKLVAASKSVEFEVAAADAPSIARTIDLMLSPGNVSHMTVRLEGKDRALYAGGTTRLHMRIDERWQVIAQQSITAAGTAFFRVPPGEYRITAFAEGQPELLGNTIEATPGPCTVRVNANLISVRFGVHSQEAQLDANWAWAKTMFCQGDSRYYRPMNHMGYANRVISETWFPLIVIYRTGREDDTAGRVIAGYIAAPTDNAVFAVDHKRDVARITMSIKMPKELYDIDRPMPHVWLSNRADGGVQYYMPFRRSADDIDADNAIVVLQSGVPSLIPLGEYNVIVQSPGIDRLPMLQLKDSVSITAETKHVEVLLDKTLDYKNLTFDQFIKAAFNVE